MGGIHRGIEGDLKRRSQDLMDSIPVHFSQEIKGMSGCDMASWSNNIILLAEAGVRERLTAFRQGNGSARMFSRPGTLCRARAASEV